MVCVLVWLMLGGDVVRLCGCVWLSVCVFVACACDLVRLCDWLFVCELG